MSSSSPSPPLPDQRSLVQSVVDSFSHVADELDATELAATVAGHSTPRNEDDGDTDEGSGPPGAIVRFWQNHVTVVVPGDRARDHLALERTFFSYHRLSILFSLFSVVIVQLQVLQHTPSPNPSFGFYVLGKPLSMMMAGMSVIIAILGAVRWWRWQRALLRGKALSGGWEVTICLGVIALVTVGMFTVVLAVVIDKSIGTRY